jgi:hypothetical protein
VIVNYLIISEYKQKYNKKDIKKIRRYNIYKSKKAEGSIKIQINNELKIKK